MKPVDMSLVDEIYDRMGGEIETVCHEKSDSEIAHFFANQTLFITGVSGYLGKCILEKLLRSCSDIKHIYILMRGNAKYSLEDRIKRYFQNVIFSRLKEEHSDFLKKVTVINGDLVSENLGLSSEDRNTLVNNVNIIYHNAANVKFDVKASVSLRVNVLGTKQVLELAGECKKLKLFAYVSSAYSHLYKKVIEEEYYPAPADLKTVYNAIAADENSEKGLTEAALAKLIGEYPNIYPFTKGIAEDLVKQYAENGKFAHVIYRPSIVVFAYNEPLAGWCGNNNGPINIFLAGSLGFLRTVYHRNHPMDFIPSDLTVNALLAVSWDAHKQWKENQRQDFVYNFGSSTTNPVTFGLLTKLFNAMPAIERSANAVWLANPVITDRLWLFYILHFFLHFLPACLLDTVLIAMGKKPRVLSIFWKATRHLDKIDYFGNGNWKIYMPRTLGVIDKMNSTDKRDFFCDIRQLSWEEQANVMWRGLKTYILKEKINSPAGLRRYNLLWYIHNGIVVMGLLMALYFVLKLVNFIF